MANYVSVVERVKCRNVIVENFDSNSQVTSAVLEVVRFDICGYITHVLTNFHI